MSRKMAHGLQPRRDTLRLAYQQLLDMTVNYQKRDCVGSEQEIMRVPFLDVLTEEDEHESSMASS